MCLYESSGIPKPGPGAYVFTPWKKSGPVVATLVSTCSREPISAPLEFLKAPWAGVIAIGTGDRLINWWAVGAGNDTRKLAAAAAVTRDEQRS